MRLASAAVGFVTLVLHAGVARPAEETVFAEARVLCPVIVRDADKRPTPPPLVVGLHGRGGTAESFAGLFRDFAEPRPAFVVPEAPYPLLVQARQPFLGWSWDFPSNDRALWARADPLVASYVLDVARRVKAEKGAGGVYLLGHSQGVAYAYMAMAQDPDLVRGVIAFAGVLPEWLTGDGAFAAAAPRVRVFIAHGRGDEAVAPDKSRRASARLEKLGFDVTYREFKGGHHVDAATLRQAHAWLEAIERAARDRD
ncbi:MAG: alpha/beta hydrolase [Acidobacteriota bacterium]